jgi:hypothetical protein
MSKNQANKAYLFEAFLNFLPQRDAVGFSLRYTPQLR